MASVKGEIGHCGAASGLASFIRGCLALYQEIIPACRASENPIAELRNADPFYLPPTPRYWLRNRADGPRRAGVSSFGMDGGCTHVVLEGWDNIHPRAEAERIAPLGRGSEFLFTLAGADRAELAVGLDLLRQRAVSVQGSDIASLAREWHHTRQENAQIKPLAIATGRQEPGRACRTHRPGEPHPGR